MRRVKSHSPRFQVLSQFGWPREPLTSRNNSADESQSARVQSPNRPGGGAIRPSGAVVGAGGAAPQPVRRSMRGTRVRWRTRTRGSANRYSQRQSRGSIERTKRRTRRLYRSRPRTVRGGFRALGTPSVAIASSSDRKGPTYFALATRRSRHPSLDRRPGRWLRLPPAPAWSSRTDPTKGVGV